MIVVGGGSTPERDDHDCVGGTCFFMIVGRDPLRPWVAGRCPRGAAVLPLLHVVDFAPGGWAVAAGEGAAAVAHGHGAAQPVGDRAGDPADVEGDPGAVEHDRDDGGVAGQLAQGSGGELAAELQRRGRGAPFQVLEPDGDGELGAAATGLGQPAAGEDLGADFGEGFGLPLGGAALVVGVSRRGPGIHRRGDRVERGGREPGGERGAVEPDLCAHGFGGDHAAAGFEPFPAQQVGQSAGGGAVAALGEHAAALQVRGGLDHGPVQGAAGLFAHPRRVDHLVGRGGGSGGVGQLRDRLLEAFAGGADRPCVHTHTIVEHKFEVRAVVAGQRPSGASPTKVSTEPRNPQPLVAIHPPLATTARA
ncbi:hypothetical protein LWC35_34125 [Pseudonocardia kujensis]|nr:hypothetical protein [Pseudonocardia kujensis]MCE0767902.1 hypothetical protein [Pseudonocardia kujensis]